MPRVPLTTTICSSAGLACRSSWNIWRWSKFLKTPAVNATFASRPLKDVADFVVAVDGHDRHQHRAGSDRGEVDDDEIVPVRKLGEYTVSLLQAHPAELGGESVGLASRLAVGQAAGAISRELALRCLSSPTVEVVEEDLVSPPTFLSEARRLFHGVPEADACVSQLIDHLPISDDQS